MRQPVGIFDSGVGGLSVARALLDRLPRESILYYADTGGFPYGERSPEEVCGLASRAVRVLISLGAKSIVVACNTASACSPGRHTCSAPLPVFDILSDASLGAALRRLAGARVGLVATPLTVASGVYAGLLDRLARPRELAVLAAPRLVRLVETGDVQSAEARTLVAGELAPLHERRLDAIILGCTHFSFLEPLIREAVGDAVALIDPSRLVAESAAEGLEAAGLLVPPHRTEPAAHRLIVTGGRSRRLLAAASRLGMAFERVEAVEFPLSPSTGPISRRPVPKKEPRPMRSPASAAPPKRTVTVRPVTTIAEYRQCMELQKAAFGYGDLSVEPLSQLVTTQRFGGVVLGAFDDGGEMVGYLYSFLGRRDDRVLHCWRLLAVSPTAQGMGVGERLALGLRERALEAGVRTIVGWFDPLEVANAKLYLGKLGFRALRYLHDHYGEMGPGINEGLATDRLEMEWSADEPPRADGPPGTLGLDAPRIAVTAVSPAGQPVCNGLRLDLDADRLLLEIPRAFQTLKRADIELARAWRRWTREALGTYVGTGRYAAVDLRVDRDDGQLATYVLERTEARP